MLLLLLRLVFILMSAMVVALYTAPKVADGLVSYPEAIVAVLATMFVTGLIVVADLMTPRKKLSAISGLFLGLIAGMLMAYALSFVVDFVSVLFPVHIPPPLITGTKVFIGVVSVFACISLVIQTKDDFRFVLPYIEFAKQIRGTRSMVVDTSAIIDGRIIDIADTQVLQGLMIVPRFVLNELQTISDSADKLKRARGRRGLDIVAKLQSLATVDVVIEDADTEGATVDQKLMSMAQDLHARLITTDFNLTKVSELRGVDVININRLAEALRPVVLPGELMSVKVVKPGESPNQGVGYLEDGTMVVVEQAREMIGEDVSLTVTSALQTSAGRMIFGRVIRSEAERVSSDTKPEEPRRIARSRTPQDQGSSPSTSPVDPS
jgi:uncharacterized protein YacL